MNNTQIFNNPEFGQVRVVILNDEPWLIGKDVAEVLKYQNTRDALSKHVDAEDKADVAVYDGSQNRNMTAINESGLYSLVLSSKLPAAKKFRHWITSDILPSIYKTGMYATEDLLNNPDLLIKAATRLKEERAARLKAEETVKQLAPAAEFGNAIGNCQDAVLIRDYCKVIANAGIKIGQDRFFSWLHVNEYIYRDKALKQWMPYQKYVDMGLFKVKETRISTKEHGDMISYTVKITGKGQKYFYEKLKGDPS